jgi:hypothetical protein
MGCAFIAYVFAVLVLWAFIHGATRKPTPKPDLDAEWQRTYDAIAEDNHYE